MKEMIYSGNGVTEILNEIDYGNGYKGLVLNTRGSFPCGYIQFPGIENLHDYDDIWVHDANIHGGFTFLGTFNCLGLQGKWLGWDYAHYGDYCCYSSPELNDEDGTQYTTEDVTADVLTALAMVMCGNYEIESEVGINEN